METGGIDILTGRRPDTQKGTEIVTGRDRDRQGRERERERECVCAVY